MKWRQWKLLNSHWQNLPWNEKYTCCANYSPCKRTEWNMHAHKPNLLIITAEINDGDFGKNRCGRNKICKTFICLVGHGCHIKPFCLSFILARKQPRNHHRVLRLRKISRFSAINDFIIKWSWCFPIYEVFYHSEFSDVMA